MKSKQVAVASALVIAVAWANAEEITVGGDVVQKADLNTSPLSSVATGVGAKANAKVNTVKGKVKVNGSLKQEAKLNKSPLSAVATGLGAEANAIVNELSSK